MDRPLKIAITLSYLFTVRDFVFTPVWDEMAAQAGVNFYLICHDPEVEQLVRDRDCPNIAFVRYPPPSDPQETRAQKMIRYGLNGQIWSKLLRWIDLNYVDKSLIYRFAALNKLSGYRVRKGRSPAERKRHQAFYYYSAGEKAGFPFPKSHTIFRLLYDLHHDMPGFTITDELSVLRNVRPDLFVHGRLHWFDTAYWAKALKRFGIPMVGIVSSWDHPTTKEPTPPGMSGYVVASRRMVEEMSGLHGIQREKICQVGKVQLDIYQDTSIFKGREEFLSLLGVPLDHRLVTFGTNTTGLKEHEVSIARYLAQSFSEGRYGKSTLLLRTHPQDINWRRDFMPLANPPWVICRNAFSFGAQAEDTISRGDDDQIVLANLMKHSDVVIQSRGSLALDAIAVDSPVISLAYDGELARLPQDSFLLEYNYEHFQPIVAAEGTWLVGSNDALDQAIRAYLRDPTIHAQGRRIVREDHLEPLDGRASKRLIAYLVEAARRARAGELPDGDWAYRGLGDVTWASRQACDVREFAQMGGRIEVSDGGGNG